MSYIKFEHRHLGDPRWLTISSSAFTVHVYALDFCNEQCSDGFIPDAMARRLLCPVDPVDLPAVFEELVEAGFWERAEGGYRCPGFLSHGIAAEEQERTRAKWAADKRRRRLHDLGNHQDCTPRSCHEARNRQASTSGQVDIGTGGQGDSGPPVHQWTKWTTRPDQTRPLKGSWGGGTRGWAQC